jgi:hypothetical protein
MKKSILLTFVFVISVFTFSFGSDASDIDGKWKGLIADQYEFAVDLKAEGEILNGTATAASGEMKVLDGVIKGNEISFKLISSQYGDLFYKGKIEGDTIALSINVGGQEIPFTMTRVKP